MLQGAPADEYSKSDNSHVTAAGSKLELIDSHMDVQAASNTESSEDGIGEVTWRETYPGIPREDIKSGKASFDGRGHIIDPSQGPVQRETTFASDTDTGLLSSGAALHAVGPSAVAARSTCVSNSRCQVKAQSGAFPIAYHQREPGS